MIRINDAGLLDKINLKLAVHDKFDFLAPAWKQKFLKTVYKS